MDIACSPCKMGKNSKKNVGMWLGFRHGLVVFTKFLPEIGPLQVEFHKVLLNNRTYFTENRRLCREPAVFV